MHKWPTHFTFTLEKHTNNGTIVNQVFKISRMHYRTARPAVVMAVEVLRGDASITFRAWEGQVVVGVIMSS